MLSPLLVVKVVKSSASVTCFVEQISDVFAVLLELGRRHNSTALNQAVAAGRYARFAYTGSAWVKVVMVATL